MAPIEWQCRISDPLYQFALSAKANDVAYMANIGRSLMDKLDSGAAKSRALFLNAARLQATAIGFDNAWVIQLYTIYREAKREGWVGSRIIAHMPAVLQGMGIDAKAGKASDINKKLAKLKDCIGVIGGDKEVKKVFSCLDYNQAANTLAFDSPYFDWIINELERANTVTTSKNTYIDPHHCMLVSSSIAKERNTPAKEIVYAVLSGLHQRGKFPDAKLKKIMGRRSQKAADLITYEIAFNTIIDRCPILQERLKTCAVDRSKTLLLKRAFTKAYELIKTRTRAYEYFIGLKIPSVLPTWKGQEATTLRITHKGINADIKLTE
jgi:hypothetical protein